MAERDADDHFTGLGECKIHTSRSHVACSNATSGCDHQTNCDHSGIAVTWRAGWVWDNEWESHHVLCISCVNRYMVLKAYTKKDRDFIDSCYRKTAWCINQEPNLIALPMKYVYQNYPASLGLNLPCHDWDHNNTGGYTDEVTGEIHTKVWQKLMEKKAEPDPCKLAKEVVAKELVDLAKDFKNRLQNVRGKRPPGGTLAAWNAPNKGSAATKWWYSFSMASDAVAAMRPATAFGKPSWASAVDRLNLRKNLAAIKDLG